MLLLIILGIIGYLLAGTPGAVLFVMVAAMLLVGNDKPLTPEEKWEREQSRKF